MNGDGAAAFAQTASTLLRDARRELALVTRALDRRIYGDPALVEAFRSFLLSGERVRLRVLLQEPRNAARAGHRLVELGRQLPSRVEFRDLPDDCAADERGELLIVDREKLLEWPDPDDARLRLAVDTPGETRRRLDRLERLWEAAPRSPELRSLWL